MPCDQFSKVSFEIGMLLGNPGGVLLMCSLSLSAGLIGLTSAGALVRYHSTALTAACDFFRGHAVEKCSDLNKNVATRRPLMSYLDFAQLRNTQLFSVMIDKSCGE